MSALLSPPIALSSATALGAILLIAGATTATGDVPAGSIGAPTRGPSGGNARLDPSPPVALAGPPLSISSVASPQASAPTAQASVATTPRPLLTAGVPTPSPTAPAQSAPVAATSYSPEDRLTSEDGSLDTHVGSYTDCSGATELPRSEAEIAVCVRGVNYFIGHNPGVFTPLMSMGVGAMLDWHDHLGSVHRYRIVATRDFPKGRLPAPSRADVTAQFQTCITPDGATNRIFDAVSFPSSSTTSRDAQGGFTLLGGLLTSR